MLAENQKTINSIIERLRAGGIDYQLFDDLAFMCQWGFVKDEENKWDYKYYSDYVKEIALKEVTVDEKHAKLWRELYWKMLKVEAYWFFESYLLYMEHKRPYEKRFYEPRMCTLRTVIDDLQKFEDSPTQRFYGLSMPARVGKLLSDDTPILTKRGWTTHGDLKAGDYVVGRNGDWVKVLQIHPKQVANKRVRFSDGTFVDCHENHEWVVIDRGHPEKEIIKETKDLVKCKYVEGDHLRRRYGLPLTCAIEGQHKNLAVDPYVMGAWLGDGTTSNPYLTICNTDTVIVEEVKKHYTHSRTFNQVGCKVYTFLGLRQDLEKYGMCHTRNAIEKYIPDDYLEADIEQRLELLAGLLDTDGSLTKKERRYHYSTTNKNICDGIVKLINSFGWRTSVSVRPPSQTSNIVKGKKDCYVIGFNPTFEIPCRVERKQLKEFSKPKKIYIESVEDIEPVPGNCISVEGGVYRFGETMKLTHNSSVILFFLTWHILRRPLSHNAMGTHSGILARHFYKEIMDIFTTDEYCFQELYQSINTDQKFIEDKSADEFTISFMQKGDFPTITCRGIDGTWTGAVDISGGDRDFGYLCVDDLVRDRTHALSPKRMNDTFSEYLNKMVDRMNDGAKQLMIGTLWNVLDPLMRLEEMYKDDDRYVFRKIPALNENNESNFQYECKGFSTEYYLEMKDRLVRAGNEAEWMAKYQQAPYVREGLLFPKEELRWFNGILPPEHKYNFVVVCDVALGGGDSVSMPIGLQNDDTNDIYIVDWYFNSSGVKVTVPGVCDMIMKYGIRDVTFEKNAGGLLYAQQVQEELQKRNYACSCETKPAPNNIDKVSKIKGYEGQIKAKIIFLDGTKHNPEEMEEDVVWYNRSAEYERALDELSMFVSIGKNPHDDAADSVSQLCIKAFGDLNSVSDVEMIDRRFLGF